MSWMLVGSVRLIRVRFLRRQVLAKYSEIVAGGSIGLHARSGPEGGPTDFDSYLKQRFHGGKSAPRSRASCLDMCVARCFLVFFSLAHVRLHRLPHI